MPAVNAVSAKRQRAWTSLRQASCAASAAMLAVALCFFVFETARHSAHHLDSDHATAECWVAVAAASLAAVDAAPVVLVTFTPRVIGMALDASPGTPLERARGTTRERAPPVRPSV